MHGAGLHGLAPGPQAGDEEAPALDPALAWKPQGLEGDRGLHHEPLVRDAPRRAPDGVPGLVPVPLGPVTFPRALLIEDRIGLDPQSRDPELEGATAVVEGIQGEDDPIVTVDVVPIRDERPNPGWVGVDGAAPQVEVRGVERHQTPRVHRSRRVVPGIGLIRQGDHLARAPPGLVHAAVDSNVSGRAPHDELGPAIVAIAPVAPRRTPVFATISLHRTHAQPTRQHHGQDLSESDAPQYARVPHRPHLRDHP